MNARLQALADHRCGGVTVTTATDTPPGYAGGESRYAPLGLKKGAPCQKCLLLLLLLLQWSHRSRETRQVQAAWVRWRGTLNRRCLLLLLLLPRSPQSRGARHTRATIDHALLAAPC